MSTLFRYNKLLFYHVKVLASLVLSRSINSCTASAAGFPFKQDLLDLVNDRHWNIIFFSQPPGSFGRIYTLDHHMDFIHGLLHGLSLTDQNTGPAVTAVHAGAGNDQVPDSGQATECFKGPAMRTPSFAISLIPLVINAAFVLSP